MDKFTELGKISEIVNHNLPIDFEGKGKMIRSKIGLAFFKALDVVIEDVHLNFLAAVELIHNASLLHDDVIDNEDTRREVPSMNFVYGDKKSVLYGNLAISNALSIILKLGDKELIVEMNNCVKKMCYGELIQQEQLTQIPTINEYIKKNRLKTGSLFKFLMIGISIFVGKYRSEFESFGDNYGIGFQISNDLKNLENGIENSSDVKNGVFTAPIIYSKSIKIDDVAIDKTKDLMDNYLRRARTVLDVLGESEYKTVLLGVIECLKK